MPRDAASAVLAFRLRRVAGYGETGASARPAGGVPAPGGESLAAVANASLAWSGGRWQPSWQVADLGGCVPGGSRGATRPAGWPVKAESRVTIAVKVIVPHFGHKGVNQVRAPEGDTVA
jgi:hypothetical protein